MTTNVEQLAERIKGVPEGERDELLSWLAEYELGREDEWDKEIERDSQPGGRLDAVLKRARQDISAGRTKPLDEVIGNE